MEMAVRAKSIWLAFLSGLLLILSFPNFNLWPLAWVGFVPLFFAIQGKPKGRAFLLAYLTGVVFWFGIVHWLIHVTLPGLIILVLYLALYFAIFGLLVSFNSPLSPYCLVLSPCLWVVLEYLRSRLFTGFPWALLGYSQYLNLPAIQIADLTGAWGVSWVVMLANVAIYSVIGYRLSVIARGKRVLIAISILIFTLLYGYYKLTRTPNTEHRTPIKISVIQANIPQELKWDPRARDAIMEKYFALTRAAVKDKPDLILWPEASIPAVLEEEPRYYEEARNFVRDIRIPLLTGAVRKEEALYYNSALLVSADGNLSGRYDKLHLVPFGEYIPLRRFLPFLETVVPIGDFTAGSKYTIFQIPNPKSQIPNNIQYPISKFQNRFSVLICFEDLFPELSRQFARQGVDFLVNITNDGWFGKTSAPYQHLSASVLRAVENRIPLVRAANTGVSGFIASSGRIISCLSDKAGSQIFTHGYQTQTLELSLHKPTLYSRAGDYFIFICLALAFYAIIARLKQKK
jgi:apolipoprotein N-acyltransferase